MDDPRLFDPVHLQQYALQAALQAKPEQAPAPPKDSARIPRWLALIGSNLFDAGSTHHAMNRGAVESNPLMRGVAGNPAALYGVKAGAGIGEALLMDLLAKRKPGLANALGFGLSGVNTAIGARNLTKGRD